MPKTLTSALQKNFFPNHEQIYYLGIGNDRLIDYVDDDVNFIFETLLLYAKNHYYNLKKEDALNDMKRHYDIALKSDASAFGISLEWLSFNFTPDMVEEEIKVKRLLELFDKETKLILFLRNQSDLLKSLYKEYIKVGLPLSFSKFIEYINDFKDRNFYYELFYDKKYKLYSKYFRNENIYFLPLENYRDKNKKLIQSNGNIKIIYDICDILDLDYPENFQIPETNTSLNDYQAYKKLELNRKYRHDFGNLIFEHSNVHRSRKFFDKENAFGIKDYFQDVKIKRLLLNEAKVYSNGEKKINYNLKSKLKKNLFRSFISSNHNLDKISNFKLPQVYFNFKNWEG
jgi:hypothetical protein